MNDRQSRSEDRISKAFCDSARLTKTLQAGIYSALLKHKQAGNSVCAWRDGKVVWIPPEQISVKPKPHSGDK